MTELLNAMHLVDDTVKIAFANQENMESVLKRLAIAIPNSSLRFKAFASYLEADELSKKLVKQVVNVTNIKPEIVEIAVELAKNLSEYDGSECVIYKDDSDKSFGLLVVMNEMAQDDLYYGVGWKKFSSVFYEYDDKKYDYHTINHYSYSFEELQEYEHIYQMHRKFKAGISDEELVSVSMYQRILLKVFRMVHSNNFSNMMEDEFSVIKNVYEYIYSHVEECFHNFYDIYFGDNADYDMSLVDCCYYYAKKKSGIKSYSIEDIYNLSECEY